MITVGHVAGERSCGLEGAISWKRKNNIHGRGKKQQLRIREEGRVGRARSGRWSKLLHGMSTSSDAQMALVCTPSQERGFTEEKEQKGTVKGQKQDCSIKCNLEGASCCLKQRPSLTPSVTDKLEVFDQL